MQTCKGQNCQNQLDRRTVQTVQGQTCQSLFQYRTIIYKMEQPSDRGFYQGQLTGVSVYFRVIVIKFVRISIQVCCVIRYPCLWYLYTRLFVGYIKLSAENLMHDRFAKKQVSHSSHYSHTYWRQFSKKAIIKKYFFRVDCPKWV